VVTVTVFISHSFDDTSAFENVSYVLGTAGVTHWPPTSVQAGESLRVQLHDAIGGCGVCVFVATRQSVASLWCHTELGAFWGVGRPIVVFRADPELAQEDLPSIVRDDVWEDRLGRLATRVKELDGEAAASADGSPVPPSTRIGNVTVEQLQQIVVGAVALLNAEAKDGAPRSLPVEDAARDAAGHLLRGIGVTSRVGGDDQGWRRHILWVDDRPDNNVYERRAMEAVGLEFAVALSTREALDLLAQRRFAAIISDMGRREGPREGYVLLDAVRARDTVTPYFIYAGSRAAAHRDEAASRGAQGTTNRPEELVEMVVAAVGATVPGR
jgi:CheY-like chemotaxis protein